MIDGFKNSLFTFGNFIARSERTEWGQLLTRLLPLLIVVGGICFWYNLRLYEGLTDEQSMDNAQVARQIYYGQGFTTKFLRPFAVAQMRDFAAAEGQRNHTSGDLFPSDRFTNSNQRILPDTYNAPGFPYILAAWFHVVHPEFGQPIEALRSHLYAGDRWIPYLNDGFILLTGALIYFMAIRLFDDRVAWVALMAFLFNDLIWRYSLTAMSTTFLMLLVTAIMACTLEIARVGEDAFKSETRPFWPAWLLTLLLGLMVAVGCLTRFNMIMLIVPLFVFLMAMPRATIGLPIIVILMALGTLAPWLYHWKVITGSTLGSNEPLILIGNNGYTGNQIYCTTSIPGYELLFTNAVSKVVTGLSYNFQHSWELLGSSVMVIFFAASLMHRFRRKRVWLFQWSIVLAALALVTFNSLGTTSPTPIDPWNILPVLLPSMLVIGTAFFFLLLDRMDFESPLLRSIIVVGAVFLCSKALILKLTGYTEPTHQFPPYAPALIKWSDNLAQPDEWVTTDIPWASAWYGDHASLWLPDSISDFEQFHDTLVPTGVLVLSTAALAQPATTYLGGEYGGEYKDWGSFVFQHPLPQNFPLNAFINQGYLIWSDTERWKAQ